MRSIGDKENYMACGQSLSMYEKARFWDHGLMGHILSLSIWELRF